MTLFHSSTVSIYLGFHVSIRTLSIYNSYLCMNKMVNISPVMSPQKISILLRLVKYSHLPIESIDNFCSHGDF